MTNTFSSLKKSSSASFEKLTEQLQKMNTSYTSDEDKYWKPEVDKAKNGYAIIRFLPASPNEDMPFVRLWDHGFQGPKGQWYIEHSLTTLGQPDPVSEYNSELWATGNPDLQNQVRKQKRRLTYISNIYVVKDPANPSNEGKVFLFKYGKKIFDKLNDLMNPTFEDEKPINPFDFWSGANFVLKIRDVEGYRNYDKSEFQDSAPLFDDDAKMEEIWNQQHSLNEIVDPKNFKSYDELKKKLYKVLGLDGGDTGSAPAKRAEEDSMDFKPNFKSAEAPKKSEASFDTDDDDTLSFFKGLAEDD